MDVPYRVRSGHLVSSNITMHSLQIKGTIIVLQKAKPHLVEHIAMQMEDLDDECLQNDLDMY